MVHRLAQPLATSVWTNILKLSRRQLKTRSVDAIEKIRKYAYFADDGNLLLDSWEVMKEPLKASKKWAEEAGMEWSMARRHILATTKSSRTDKLELGCREINIAKMLISLGHLPTSWSNKRRGIKQTISWLHWKRKEENKADEPIRNLPMKITTKTSDTDHAYISHSTDKLYITNEAIHRPVKKSMGHTGKRIRAIYTGLVH